MEQVNKHQWLVQEEEAEQEEGVQDVIALKGRKSLNDAGVIIPPSFFSLDTNGCSGHSNGVCLASGDETLLQKEEVVEAIVHDVENENHVSVELAGAATNGEAIDSAVNINVTELQNMNSVYFDKQQGMWKCHHYSWTKRFDSPWNVPFGNLKGHYSELLMSIKLKTMIQHGTCFVYETKGNEFNGLKGIQNGDGASPVPPKIHGEGEINIQVENPDVENSLRNETNNQYVKTIDDEIPFSPEISPLQNSSEVQATTFENFGDKSSAKTGPNLMKEIDQKLEEELDVEAVLAKQETHELFCPNCNSCITKRVILKKRKRSIKHLDTKAKRDKWVKSSEQEANQVDHAIATSDVGTIEPPPVDNHEPEREAEVFRCLSCFSFFIPLRNGFKLFPTFGGASQNPSITPVSNLENPSIIAASKENWLFSLFASNDRKKARGQGDSSVENPRPCHADHHHSSSTTTSNVLTSSQIDNPEDQVATTAISKNTQPTPDTNSSVKSATTIGSHMERSTNSSVPPWEEPLPDQKWNNPSFQNDLLPIHSPIQNSNDVMNEEQKIGMDFIDIPEKEEPMNEDVRIDVGEKNNDPVDVANIGMQEPQSPAESFGSEMFANDVTSDKVGSEVDATIPPDQDFINNVQKDIEEEIRDSSKQEPSKSSTSQTENDVQDKGDTATEAHTQIDIGEQPIAETDESKQWEIVKSIVYGGLIESITSLGIVSSAASSGAAPLNIIALGLANLIGGLFIIGHDLIELKKENSEETNTQEDRYQELLGQRANFLLHAVVAVLSFLIFGSVPLVVYGLLIRENYSAEVTILVVAATSVVCITLLAIGKAYTKTTPKSYIKTVLIYVTMALATSGVSYIAGDLVKELLEKFTSQDSNSSLVLNMPFSRTTWIEPTLMSY